MSYETDPRDYALEQVEDGNVDPNLMLLACLKWMSSDEVREMLDANELSPRFLHPDEDQGLTFDPLDHIL